LAQNGFTGLKAKNEKKLNSFSSLKNHLSLFSPCFQCYTGLCSDIRNVKLFKLQINKRPSSSYTDLISAVLKDPQLIFAPRNKKLGIC